MAVYKRAYEPYGGPREKRWSRCLVLTRYALRDLFASRFFLGAFIVCLVPVLLFGGYIFVANSDLVKMVFSLVSRTVSLQVETRFFAIFLDIQASLIFLLTCWAGPTLVAGDLTNGALPLFLSRPFSRAEYVIGKFAVLGILLSSLTWVPALLLLFLEAGLGPKNWLGAHLWMIGPIVWLSVVWIALLSLVALAASAWVRWRIVAIGVIFGLFVFPAGLGAVMDGILGTHWGRLLDLTYLFGELLFRGLHTTFLRGGQGVVPPSAAWAMLLASCAASLWLLHVRLRAFEVVRG
jgi:ABC-type transport system involved in multi-copper enzyme maturation permease subunit